MTISFLGAPKSLNYTKSQISAKKQHWNPLSLRGCTFQVIPWDRSQFSAQYLLPRPHNRPQKVQLGLFMSSGYLLVFSTLILHQDTFFPRRVSSPLLKIGFPHLQHLYLRHHFASILVLVRVDFRHELPSCTHVFMVPHWTFTVWQHHRVALV